jgi:predicted lipid-binding transport protein (Tim44 family)
MDIIFFAAIALYIFFKLKSQLGKIDEEEKRQIEERIAKRREEILNRDRQMAEQMQHAGQSSTQSKQPSNQVLEIKDEVSEKIFSTLDETTKENLINILQTCKISAEFFVNGASSAFEMIIKAFATSDLETLKFLLSEKIYQGFETAINQRKAANQTLTTNVISIQKVEIVSAAKFENIATVAVKFLSKQINYITDHDGKVIQGRKDQISEITDIWTFKKDLTKNDPNWIVVATSNS